VSEPSPEPAAEEIVLDSDAEALVLARERGPHFTRFRAWVLTHDDKRVFIVLYIGLSVVLSLWISLFWLVAVVAVHGVFEWYTQQVRVGGRRREILARTVWELKLDIGLVIFSLVLTLYMEVVMGAAGVGVGARAGVQAGARFAAWQRVLRAVLLTVDDAAQVARLALASRKKKKKGADATQDDAEAAPEEPPAPVAAPSVWGGWAAPWGLGDRLSVGFGVICLVLLLLAPLATGQSVAELLTILGEELHPWP